MKATLAILATLALLVASGCGGRAVYDCSHYGGVSYIKRLHVDGGNSLIVCRNGKVIAYP